MISMCRLGCLGCEAILQQVPACGRLPKLGHGPVAAQLRNSRGGGPGPNGQQRGGHGAEWCFPALVDDGRGFRDKLVLQRGFGVSRNSGVPLGQAAAPQERDRASWKQKVFVDYDSMTHNNFILTYLACQDIFTTPEQDLEVQLYPVPCRWDL
jgi:hypothetical protein